MTTITSIDSLYAIELREQVKASDFLCEWTMSERDVRLEALATQYHQQCEAYDQTVCSRRDRRGVAMPFGPRELYLVNRNAHEVRRTINAQAEQAGFTREEVSRAIQRKSNQ